MRLLRGVVRQIITEELLIEKLANDTVENIRFTVAMRSNLSDEIRQKLANDTSEAIRNYNQK